MAEGETRKQATTAPFGAGFGGPKRWGFAGYTESWVRVPSGALTGKDGSTAMNDDTFLEFVSLCRSNPPLEVVPGQVEFSLIDWTRFIGDRSATECRELLRPFEKRGWIQYTEVLFWRIRIADSRYALAATNGACSRKKHRV